MTVSRKFIDPNHATFNLKSLPTGCNNPRTLFYKQKSARLNFNKVEKYFCYKELAKTIFAITGFFVMEKRYHHTSPHPPFSEGTSHHHKHRALRVLQHCNEVLFRAQSEQELLSEVCRIIVEDGDYRLAWIGYPEFTDQKPIFPVAHCGYEEGYLEKLSVTWQDSARGHGPAGMAVRTRKPYIVRDVHADPHFIPWRENAIEHGYSAVAAFPLFINEKLPSVLLVYAGETNSFDKDELSLLLHFSEALSYGIENIRLKEKNQQVEKALRESEQHFRFILDASPIAVRVAKNHGHSYAYANASYSQFFNTDLPTLSAGDPEQFYADKNDYVEITEQLEQGETINNRLVKYSIPNAEAKWGLSTYIPIEFEGEPAVLAWFYDITDRKKFEDNLLLSEEAYVKAFRSIPEALSITSMSDGKYIEVNEGCTHILGYQRNELIGHTSLELNIWPDIEQRNNLLALVDEKGKFNNLEVQFQSKDGSVKDVLISGEAITIEQQPCIILSARDFTERKQTQDELRQLRNYLANIIDSMPSILIGVDLDGLVTQWNQEAINVTGISIEKAQGQSISDVFPNLSIKVEQITEAIRSRQKLTELHRPNTKNGEQHFEETTIYPLIANGVEGAVVRVDNVTERVRLEEMMIQSEKMLSVGGLAAGMAHEINNPLAGVMQTARVMNSRLTSKNLPANVAAAEKSGIDLDALYNYMDDRGILRMLLGINDSSIRIAEIIDNMLNFSRKSDAIPLPWNMTELLDKSLALAASDYDMKKQYDFKSIKVVKEYQDNVPDITCEASKIQQVFLNLFRNGAQAMQEANTENPTFILRTHYNETEGMLSIEIEDNGPGMDKNIQKRLFEPFFTTKEEGVGTGLGLSVSYFIVTDNHGGEMSVKSAPNKGSCFTIRLPYNKTSSRMVTD
jgi:PAS domain S-box-containing protein